MWSTPYTTDGLLLRAWEPGDGPALAAAKRASYEHLKPWMPWAEPDPDEAAEEKRVRLFAGKWLIGEDALVSIWTPDCARLLGGSGFHPREGDYATRQAEAGMLLEGTRRGTYDDVTKGRRDELLFAALAPEWRDPEGLSLPEPA